MSDSQDSRSEAPQPPEQSPQARPEHEQLPLLGADAWEPHVPPTPEPEPAREDIPDWLCPGSTLPDTPDVRLELPQDADGGESSDITRPADDASLDAEVAAVAASLADDDMDAGEARADETRSVPEDSVEADARDHADPAAAEVGRSAETESERVDAEPASAGDETESADDAPESEGPEPEAPGEAASDLGESDRAVDDADESEDDSDGSALWPQDDPDFRPFAELGLAGGVAAAAIDADEAEDAVEGGESESGETPLVDRVRPPRQPYVSRKAILFTLLAVLGVAAIAGGIVWFVLASRVPVPNLVGTTVNVATVEAARSGLEVVVAERRFSQYPIDQILEQQPAQGTQVRRGSQVTVVVSAGTEDFALPDITGSSIAVARAQLQQKGLQIEIVSQPSQEPSGTVLGTIPGPSTPVATGDVIRVTVASESAAGGLKAYKLVGRVFVIDPAPAVEGTNDIALEVARRLQALLEASDAKVVVTRSASTSGTAESARAASAKAAAPNAVVGLGVSKSDPAGIVVERTEASSITQLAESTQLQGDIARALKEAGYVAASDTVKKDTVLQATNAASVRVMLGSASSKKDTGAFRDPKWADGIARAIYQALGQRYGSN